MRIATLGHITDGIDLPQVAFWVFFLFFVALCLWLRMQDKREGYPTKKSPFSSETSPGILPMPDPITYYTMEGEVVVRPDPPVQMPTSARPLYAFDGTPLSPIGNPLLAGIGPGAWVKRRPGPMLTEEGDEMFQPMRVAPGWEMMRGETDPRGMAVQDRYYKPVGTVVELWIDRGARIWRMLEVELSVALGGRRVLVPIYHTVVHEDLRRVRVTSLLAHQFADIPALATADSITGDEIEQLNAYFAAGEFYRNSPLTEPPPEPGRAGPIMGAL